MRVAIATLLVVATIALAGCPGTDGGSDVEPQGGEPTTIDNDAGAEPVNPGNGSGAGNGTDDGFTGVTATANGTATPGVGDGE